MKPFFSIIIPAYNASKTIDDTLKSVLDQSFADYEILLINDGSTDDTLWQLETFKQTNPTLLVNIFSQENSGLGASRNLGIKNSNGRFIAFLDADDTWHKDKLAVCKSILDRQDPGILYHSMESSINGNSFTRPAQKHQSIKDLLLNGSSIIPSATVIKRSIATSHLFSTEPQFHGVEDLDLWIRLLRKEVQFMHIPKILGHYHEESGMSKNLNEHISHFRNLLQYLLEQEFIDLTTCKKAMKRKYYEIARFYHKRKQLKLAMKYYLKAPEILPKKLLERLH